MNLLALFFSAVFCLTNSTLEIESFDGVNKYIYFDAELYGTDRISAQNFCFVQLGDLANVSSVDVLIHINDALNENNVTNSAWIKNYEEDDSQCILMVPDGCVAGVTSK